MICEIFIKDSDWRDSVQSYTMFLFKVDLMKDRCKRIIGVQGKVTLVNVEEERLGGEREVKEFKGVLKEV